MLVKNDYVGKQDVVFVKENDTLEYAIRRLDESGYRCIPVLDEDELKYVGNIYKVDLLEYEQSKTLNGKVTNLVTDQHGHVKEDDPFFKVFTSIKQLPYLAIVGDTNEFLGILTNGNVIQVLENAWGANNGSFSLTIGTLEYAGVLRKILRIINKYCNVQSVISLNNGSKYVRRICIVLPIEADEQMVDKIKKDLEKNGDYMVTDIEKLN